MQQNDCWLRESFWRHIALEFWVHLKMVLCYTMSFINIIDVIHIFPYMSMSWQHKVAMTLSLWETLRGFDSNRSRIGTWTTIRWYEKRELNFREIRWTLSGWLFKLDAIDCQCDVTACIWVHACVESVHTRRESGWIWVLESIVPHLDDVHSWRMAMQQKKWDMM